MDKISTLNELDVTDYSCTGGECEYVLAENCEENRRKLLDSGFSEQEIKEANDNNDNEIDLSYLAFNYTGAKWWHVQTGFSNDPELPKKRLPLPFNVK